jgi:hypothetical protein
MILSLLIWRCKLLDSAVQIAPLNNQGNRLCSLELRRRTIVYIGPHVSEGVDISAVQPKTLFMNWGMYKYFVLIKTGEQQIPIMEGPRNGKNRVYELLVCDTV